MVLVLEQIRLLTSYEVLVMLSSVFRETSVCLLFNLGIREPVLGYFQNAVMIRFARVFFAALVFESAQRFQRRTKEFKFFSYE